MQIGHQLIVWKSGVTQVFQGRFIRGKMSRTGFTALCCTIIALLFVSVATTSDTSSSSRVRELGRTYNLLDFSQIQVTKTLTEKPTKRSGSLCVNENESGGYKCKSRVFHGDGKPIENDRMLHNLVRKGGNSWKLQFDRHTRGVDIVVTFAKPYLVNNLLIAFKDFKSLAAGYVKIRKTDGSVYKQNFAGSKLICNILFDVNVEDCLVVTISSALKILFKELIPGISLTVHLFTPINHNFNENANSEVIINHFKIYGRCFCSNNIEFGSCVVASEDDTTHNVGYQRVLVCGADVKQLPSSYLVHKRKRRSLCECSSVGTFYGVCSPIVGLGHQCPCKHKFRGKFCNKCSDGFHGYPSCNECLCHFIGSKKPECDVMTGQCECDSKYIGLKCNKCAPGRYNFPFCLPCPCPAERTKPSICDSVTGACYCSERFQGGDCASCAKRFQNFPVCHRPGCKCNKLGSSNGTCNSRFQCFCKPQYTGKRCDQCKTGFGDFPRCTEGKCDNRQIQSVYDILSSI